jgi:hypothetical protein
MDAMVTEKNGYASDTGTLMLFGGVACMIFGAGLVLSNPAIRRYLGQMSPGDLLSTAVPDVEKYLKLRAM